MPNVTIPEPFGLAPEAIERIADDAGAEDDNVARRILRAYWHCEERRERDAALVEEALRELEHALVETLPRSFAPEIRRAAATVRERLTR
ncbi:MAG TPA: hypothetical protein VFA44_00965 [Gaiellaceae bacterium]|nr:hypothetical protein [Gaiellaceae bacterium]